MPDDPLTALIEELEKDVQPWIKTYNKGGTLSMCGVDVMSLNKLIQALKAAEGLREGLERIQGCKHPNCHVCIRSKELMQEALKTYQEKIDSLFPKKDE